MHGVPRISIVSFLLLLSTAFGCTHYVEVPETELIAEAGAPDTYRDGEYGYTVFKGEYIFNMTDGSRLAPTRFVRTDSTYVIFEVFDGVKNVEIDPMTVLASDIERIRKIGVWWLPTATFMAAGISIGLLMLATLALGRGLTGLG